MMFSDNKRPLQMPFQFYKISAGASIQPLSTVNMALNKKIARFEVLYKIEY